MEQAHEAAEAGISERVPGSPRTRGDPVAEEGSTLRKSSRTASRSRAGEARAKSTSPAGSRGASASRKRGSSSTRAAASKKTKKSSSSNDTITEED